MDKLYNDFSFGLFFWQAAILIVLIVLLRKYAWKPILSALNAREEGILEALESAEKARMEMENLQADNASMLQEARGERDSMLKEARGIKEKMIADAAEEADKKADSIIKKAQEAIESEKQSAMAELKDQVGVLSIEIAEKVIKKELNGKDQQMELVDTMLNDVKLN